MRHVDVPHSGPQVVDLVVVGLKGSHELVDVGVGGSELLGSDGGVSFHYGGESVGHHSCDFSKFVPTEMDEGFG